MSDTVEKTQDVVSCSLPETSDPAVSAPYSSSELLVSRAEPLSSSSSDPSSALDQYSAPHHLSLDTVVSVRDPQQFAGRRTLTVQSLLGEAVNSEAARDELLRVVRPLSADTRRMEMCYAGDNDTLGLILAQLTSSDAVVRNEGRLALEQYILGDSSNPQDNLELRLGALATVARLRQVQPENQDAKSLLVNVYRQCPHNSPLGQGIDRLSNRSVILQAVGQANVATRTDAPSPGNATLLAGTASAAFVGGGGTPGVDAALAYTVLPVLSPALALLTPDQNDRVINATERALQGTHLEAIPSEEIVATVQRHLGPAADQFREDLRRGLLALGMRYTDFSGAHFLAHANVATRVADRVADIVFGDSVEVRNAGPVSPRPEETFAVADLSARAPVPAPHAAPLSASANGAPVLPAGFVDGLELAAGFPSQPALTLSLAGMQGASRQSNGLTFAFGGPSAFSFQNHASYVIEGPTAEEAPHDGNSGGSHSGSGEQGRQDRDQTDSQPDVLLA